MYFSNQKPYKQFTTHEIQPVSAYRDVPLFQAEPSLSPKAQVFVYFFKIKQE